MVENDQLAARLADPTHLTHDFDGIGHAIHDVRRVDDVERVVCKLQVRCIHLHETHVGQPLPSHAAARLLEHRRGKVDAGDAAVARVEGGVDTGSYAHFEHAIAGHDSDSLECEQTTRMKDRPEDEVVH